ncbi:hypothetical protein Taro_009278 [Colocasia esculenta]|uniref:SBP-type domain-containing protein n=1 Tax=Colocasia esculenta TaxID=4460 RepID=A0A843U3L0_COLES|nr:hypothetical protein [Colocasia esculenta]
MESSPYTAAEPLAFADPLPAAAGARDAGMELLGAGAGAAEEAAGVWDWGNLLDFTIEEDVPLMIPWEQDQQSAPAPPPPATLTPQLPLQESSPGSSIQGSTTAAASRAGVEAMGRVRKRDPRLVCENFLAGRVPCSCPEEDEKEEEEEAVGAVAGGGRKKVRTGGVAAIARCQVPGCGADIRELKGYHRRHRVCLRCANASSVFLDGESKRYCQQCGKFHILPDFDEGKRSCRRKLERHNKRRRRKPGDPRSMVESEKDSLSNFSVDAACDEEPKANTELSNGIASGVDSVLVSDKVLDTETSLEPEDEQGSPGLSVPSFPTVQSNSMLSFATSGETQMEERIDNTKSTISSSFCRNKSAYSSLCPTGRVSFKLYDWNPADFPRRLRHQVLMFLTSVVNRAFSFPANLQIFQWLASMPVELEGYIRPGCTILTLFIVMPQLMWDKLSKESAVYVNDLVKAPQSLFSGRRNMLIYLNNKIFQVTEESPYHVDGTLLENIKMEVQVPKLHYVHPNCFESGKPVEFVACGSNLLRHKFRFLVSFAGRYLHNEFCGVVSHGMIKSGHEIRDDVHSSEHQIIMIRIHTTEPDMFGPAFVEVENECGISNFLPVLFGNQNICTEMMKLQESPNDSLSLDIVSQTGGTEVIPCLCDKFVSSQTSTSDLLLDIAWFLKEPASDRSEILSSLLHIQRLNCLLKHLLQNESFSTLERLLDYLDILTEGKDLREFTSTVCDPEVEFFLTCVSKVRNILHKRRQLNRKSDLDSGDSSAKWIFRKDGDFKVRAPSTLNSTQNQDAKNITGGKAKLSHASKEREEKIALLNKDIANGTNWGPYLASKRQQDSWFHMYSGRITGTRLAVLVMVSVVMCCGICVALLHPHRAGDFVIKVRRCLFGVSGNDRVGES